jgi:hypothetical protein
MDIDNYWLKCQYERGYQREKISRNHEKYKRMRDVIELMMQAYKSMSWEGEPKGSVTIQEWDAVKQKCKFMRFFQ